MVKRQGAAVVGRWDEAFFSQFRDGGSHHDAGGGLSQRHAGRLGHERHGARGARVGLNDIKDVILQGELDVHQPLHTDALGQAARGFAHFVDVLWPQRHRRQGARGVAGVNAGFLDVLHHAAQVDLVAVAQGVDIDLDGRVQEAVHQDRVVWGELGGALDIVLQRLLIVDDFHAAAAQYVGRANQNRVADGGRDLPSLLEGGCGAIRWRCQLCLIEDLAEFAAVLGGVNGRRAGAHHRYAGGVEALCQAQRGLAAQLHQHAGNLAGGCLCVVDLHDVFEGQRLEVQAVSGVIVGRYRLWVAVDHHGLISLAGKLKGGVHAGVVEFDALANAVRARAQDDDLALRAFRRRVDLGFGIGVQLIGAVVVWRLRLELAGARIDGLEDGANAHAPAQAAHAVFAVELGAQGGNLGIGKPKDFGLAQELLGEHGGIDKLLAEFHQALELRDEPWVHAGGFVDLIHRSAEAQGQLDIVHAALGGALEILEHRLHVGGALARKILIRLGPEPVGLVFQRTHDLIQARDVVAADAHGLTHRFHRGGQGVIGAGEFLEGKAGRLDDDIVQGRLERRLGFAGDVILHLIQGVADGQFRGQLGNGETRGLGGQRRGAGYARVHLDDDDAAIIRVQGELDIAAAGINTHLADDVDAQIAHLLELAVRQRQRRRHGHGITGVHAQGIDVFDGGDDDHVVIAIAHELELEFFPAEDGFLDEHISLRRGRKPAAGDAI